jgi:LPS export ABC transporter protein LptC
MLDRKNHSGSCFIVMNTYKLLIVFFCFISCEDNFQEIKNINNYENFPIGIAEDIKLIYTDSAKVKAVLTSSLNNDYTNQSFPYSEFPDGIEITFFDNKNQKTIVTADYAVTYSKTNIVDLIGNVIINIHDGSVLRTSQLYWDPEQEWLFTEKQFSFKNIDYDIVATRLDANRSFTIFNTGELDGQVMIEDNKKKNDEN